MEVEPELQADVEGLAKAAEVDCDRDRDRDRVRDFDRLEQRAGSEAMTWERGWAGMDSVKHIRRGLDAEHSRSRSRRKKLSES